jgi:hypothetical protein
VPLQLYFMDDELVWRDACEELGAVAEESIVKHPGCLDAHEVKLDIWRLLAPFPESRGSRVGAG